MSTSPFGSAAGAPRDSVPGAPGARSDRPSRPSSRTTLAFAALIVCLAAFVLGLIPLIGVALGLVGLVLVVLAARRGLATRRTYAGAVAAAVGLLASAATTVALVGFVLIPGSEDSPEPAIASGEAEELEEDPQSDAQPSVPAADDEPAAPVEPTDSEQPVADEETETAPVEETGPTEVPAPVSTAAPDLTAYEELDERSLAQIVKAPDDHIGRQAIVYGTITQLDAATGKCFVRVSIAHAPQDQWYEYEHNSVGFAGDGESDCPVLDPFVADDEVKLWITVGGSISYDTQIGGSTTVPAYVIDAAEPL
ncbi:hypothetical protein ACTXJ9_01790 [Brachybacterium tyrofermentans]|uniref:hypothetical protein n=1 Tax=Brachybacterium tyrofermentans TaxID=47848 RepID=UPI003FCF12E4